MMTIRCDMSVGHKWMHWCCPGTGTAASRHSAACTSPLYGVRTSVPSYLRYGTGIPFQAFQGR